MRMERGEVTAYLSLVFILLVTFAASIMESASIQNAKNYSRADMNRAAECIFAEYQKELLEEYDIFALEGSYETGEYKEQMLFDRLSYYGAGSMDHRILRIQFLTDSGGLAFREQAAAYMEHKYGIDRVKKYFEETEIWEEQETKSRNYGKNEQENEKKLESLLKENETELREEDNPIDYVKGLKNSPILALVMPKNMQVSEKSLVLSDTVSQRELNAGYGDFSDASDSPGTFSSLLFGEYVMEHFTDASKERHTGALDYQTEYILSGKASDKDNLEAAAKKLLLMRFVPNYAYLQTDSGKKAEAEALALTLCSLLTVPAVTEAVVQALLFAWAYGESVMDVRSLLAGNRVPLVKTKESWQLQLTGILKLGTKEDQSDGADAENGLRYKEYLRMLLFLENQEKAGMRALDLVEQNLRLEKGQEYLRVDQCISKIEFSTERTLRRGITYRFPTYFAYR